MRVVDALLVAAYAAVSTVAILLVKQFASPALEAWKSAPGYSVPGALLLTGATLYAASFLLWMVVLSRNELSVVYPLMIGLTLATTTAAAGLILQEPLSATRVGGIGVVFVGILLVTRQ